VKRSGLLGGAPLFPIAMICGLNMVAQLDRQAFAVLTPNIRDTFHVTNATIGGIVGAATVVMVLAGLPAAWLAERHSRRLIVASAAMLWGGVACLTGVAAGIPILLGFRILSGLAQSPLLPVVPTLVADYYIPEHRMKAFGLSGMATPAGTVIGPLLAGVAAALGGWRVAFLVAGIPSIALGVLALRLRDPHRGGTERLEGQETAHEPALPLGQAFRLILSNATVRLIFVGLAVMGFVLLGIGPFVAVYLRDIWHLSDSSRGGLASIMALAGLVALPLGGVLGTRLAHRSRALGLYLTAGGLTVFGLLYPLAIYAPSLLIFSILGWVCMFAAQIGIAPAYAIFTDILPPRLRSTAFAMGGIFAMLFAGLVAPALVGWMADVAGIRFALACVSPSAILAGAAFLASARHVPYELERLALGKALAAEPAVEPSIV